MTVKKVKDNITPSIRRINRQLNDVPPKAFDFWIKKTPKKGGNARRRTKLVNKKTIVADYNYAKRLDEGYSKQAPEGTSQPTLRFVKTLVKSILRRK
jgi:hypothetical protein